MSDRYVVLGLAAPRSPWFADVARWASEAVLPVDFIKCLTVDEVRSRLASGRLYSALVVDDDARGVDRDLIEQAAIADCPVLAVTNHDTASRWLELGAKATLSKPVNRDALLDALVEYALPVSSLSTASLPPPIAGMDDPQPWRGKVVAVTGAPGAGTSTIASVLSQGMADDAHHGALVALVDFAHRADQAMMHDIDDVVPGVSELVESHRNGTCANEATRANLFGIAERRYDLLLGLRRQHQWTALRPRATAAALESLRRAYRIVVADLDDDVEDESLTGSADVEDRNVLSRTTLGAADVIIVVGQPSLWGLHGMARTLVNLADAGYGTGRTIPVINKGPRRRRERADVARALHDVLGPRFDWLPSPTFFDNRPSLERIANAAGRYPEALGRPLATTVSTALSAAAIANPALAEPVAIVPGELGSFSELDPESGAA